MVFQSSTPWEKVVAICDGGECFFEEDDRHKVWYKYGISRGMVFQCGWKVLWSKSLETLEEVRIAFRYLLDLMWEMVLRFFFLERYIWNSVTILKEGILNFS